VIIIASQAFSENAALKAEATGCAIVILLLYIYVEEDEHSDINFPVQAISRNCSKHVRPNMNKVFAKANDAAVAASKKLTNVSVNRGKTVFPKTPKDLENIGIRLDFDGEVQHDGLSFNKFQVQPNAGKVPSTAREWRDKNGGTHAVMGSLYVKKDGEADDVRKGFEDFEKEFQRYAQIKSSMQFY